MKNLRGGLRSTQRYGVRTCWLGAEKELVQTPTDSDNCYVSANVYISIGMANPALSTVSRIRQTTVTKVNKAHDLVIITMKMDAIEL